MEQQSYAFAILDSASRHIYGEAQRARSRDEYENFSISLKLLQLLRDGWATGPSIFDVACGFAVGLCHARYLYRRGERAAFMRKEFLSITPDYDYSRETVPNRDSGRWTEALWKPIRIAGHGHAGDQRSCCQTRANKARNIYASQGWMDLGASYL